MAEDEHRLTKGKIFVIIGVLLFIVAGLNAVGPMRFSAPFPHKELVLGIVNATVDSPTQITAYVRVLEEVVVATPISMTYINITTTWVNYTECAMSPPFSVLGIDQVQKIVVTGVDTDWTDGNLYQLTFFAGGPEATINIRVDSFEYGVWIPISGFAPIRTTMLDAQQKLNVPLRIPSSEKIQSLGMHLVSVLCGGDASSYYITYLIYGNSPIDPDKMSVGDAVDSGHLVVIEGDSGWPLGDIEGIYNAAANGETPGCNVTYLGEMPAIMAEGQIAVYGGTVIYEILAPSTVTADQLTDIANSLFE